ncbi:hypothetical protein GCM10020358_33810 [Amorphoplanes nipponensis]
MDSRSEIERLGDQLRTPGDHRAGRARARRAAEQNLIHHRAPRPVPAAGAAGPRTSYLPAREGRPVGGELVQRRAGPPTGSRSVPYADVAAPGTGCRAASGMAHLRFALVAWLSIGICDPAAGTCCWVT